jgi:hypothetical protein
MLQARYGPTIILIDYEPGVCLWHTPSNPQYESFNIVFDAFDCIMAEREDLVYPLDIPRTFPREFRVTGCENAGGRDLHYHDLACEVCIPITRSGQRCMINHPSFTVSGVWLETVQRNSFIYQK